MVQFDPFCLPIIPVLPEIEFRSPFQSPIRITPRRRSQDLLTMVLSQMITVESVLTASTTDFLAGTQLDQPGVAGVYTVWAASTVGDTTMTITLGGRQVTSGAVVTLRANSEIRENEDTFFQMLSQTGGRPVINITEVTAASIRVRVKFIPAALS